PFEHAHLRIQEKLPFQLFGLEAVTRVASIDQHGSNLFLEKLELISSRNSTLPNRQDRHDKQMEAARPPRFQDLPGTTTVIMRLVHAQQSYTIAAGLAARFPLDCTRAHLARTTNRSADIAVRSNVR